jgi:hypothetical protein
LQQQIRTAEERLVNYAKNNQIISLDPNQNTVVERLAGLNRQLSKPKTIARLPKPLTTPRRIPTPPAPRRRRRQTNKRDRSEAVELRQKRALLLVDATEEAPEVKEVDQQIRTR